jgi:transcriptional regulator
MLQGIVAFAMPIERIDGKFKLSQNRSVEDRQRVARQLTTGAPGDQAVADLMAKYVLS